MAGDEWWTDVTLPMLELLRRRVRELVRLVEKSKRAIVYTDFEDRLGELEEVPLHGFDVGTDFERFRDKARVYLRTHVDHVAVQKLRRNRQLSATDLAEATFPGYTYVIVSIRQGEPHDLTAWTLAPDRSRFDPEPIMHPDTLVPSQR